MSEDIEPIQPIGRARRVGAVQLPDPRRRGLMRLANRLVAAPTPRPPVPAPDAEPHAAADVPPRLGEHLDATA